MIKANELRVGNVVVREYNNRGLEYDNNYVITEQVMGLIFGEDTSIALNDLFPIPLTPEVLEKCGFVKENNGWRIKLFGLFDHNYGRGELKLRLNAAEIICPEVKYLHQLQNLYYTHTYEELEYKP